MTLVLFILFAAILGSFLASFIYRYVNKNIEKDAFVQSINIYTEPSFCPACKTKIDWYHLIPILSYLFLGGKAKCCGATISSRYFFIEILVISLFLLINSTFAYSGGHITDEEKKEAIKCLGHYTAITFIPAIIPNSVRIFISVVDKTKKPTAVVRLVIKVMSPIVLMTFLNASL